MILKTFVKKFHFDKMIEPNITSTEETVQREKILVQTFMYNEKVSKNYVSTRVRLNGNPKPSQKWRLHQMQIDLLKD